LKQVEFRSFTPSEHGTWKTLFDRQAVLRDVQIHPIFSRGIQALGMTGERIPDLERVNAKLRKLTGWEGVAVEGFEEIESFYPMLARRQFPIGNFIRDKKDLSYTPAPDVFHDLYGHLPFFTDPVYADFCHEFGVRAMKHIEHHERLLEFERLFWFALEFGLIEMPEGRRIFGAGIASSFGECEYALSDRPNVVPFDLDVIRKREFRIDVFQETLFLLRNVNELYECLGEFEKSF
jgi:phenylalanine-4-hydroxylase